MKRVALTGGIATGKSHVRARFAALGVPTIDADVLSREVVAPGTSGAAAIRERFGEAVFDPDGSLDRRALSAVVFAQAEARRALEAIVHPAVRSRIAAWFVELEGTDCPVAIADIPLLFETGREGAFDAVIVVACDPGAQLQRLMDRDGMTEADARQRIAAQLPIGDKVARATYVIRTDGTVEETDRQVRAVHQRLVGGQGS